MSERLRIRYQLREDKRIKDAVHAKPNNAAHRAAMHLAGESFKSRHPEWYEGGKSIDRDASIGAAAIFRAVKEDTHRQKVRDMWDAAEEFKNGC